jgi:hypothetical protein
MGYQSRESFRVRNYLHNLSKHMNTTFVVSPQGCYFLYEGKKYTRAEFSEMFPIAKIPAKNPKGDNPDGTKKWMEL